MEKQYIDLIKEKLAEKDAERIAKLLEEMDNVISTQDLKAKIKSIVSGGESFVSMLEKILGEE